MSSNPPPKTILIGLSGPSSSGKTTLARLLRSTFTVSSTDPSLSLTILHQDDFYKTDTQIPRRTFSSPTFGTRQLDDWDCIDAIDLPLLEQTLGHIKHHGALPSDMVSKEDQNAVGESGVSGAVIDEYQRQVTEWMTMHAARGSVSSSHGEKVLLDGARKVKIVLLDGFLLYPSPGSSSQHATLRELLARVLSAKLFVPSTRDLTIDRRTKRSGYVTLEGFWEDPPGYVQDVVWPNYTMDHAWLFDAGGESSGQDGVDEELQRRVDAGEVNRETAERAGILVGPGTGERSMGEVFDWAVGQIRGITEHELERN